MVKSVESEEQSCSQESQGRAEQLAKMLVQMLWHLKAVSVTRPVVPQTKGEEYLTIHTRNEEEGKTIKALICLVHTHILLK
jgi:hypothetical protein